MSRLAYAKTVWVDNQAPPMDAVNMDHLEGGVESVVALANENGRLAGIIQGSLNMNGPWSGQTWTFDGAWSGSYYVTKKYAGADTDLVMFGTNGCWVSNVGTTGATYHGMTVNDGTTYQYGKYWHNLVQNHDTFPCFLRLTGLAAGQVKLTPVVKTSASNVYRQTDSADTVCMFFFEVPAGDYDYNNLVT